MNTTELSEQVAIEVMGWEEQRYYCEDSAWYDPVSGKQRLFHPATDGNDMLKVIEAMNKRGLTFEGEWCPAGDGDPDEYMVCFYNYNVNPIRKFGYAPTLPEAVCLAALAAVKGTS